ncbi:MAG: tetratricopeptide repeat protein, partial [Chitinophagaceae bacterium]
IRGTESKQPVLEFGHYYKGIAFLKTNNTKEAILNLQWVQKNSTDKNLQLKAQWYLALAYLKSNNSVEAINLLKKIADKSAYHRYKKTAQNLLNDLE